MKDDLSAVGHALLLIKEDINTISAKSPNIVTRFLTNLHSEASSFREELSQILSKLFIQIEEKITGDQAGFEAHLHGCYEWLKELRSILENQDDASFSIDEEQRKIKVADLY